MLYHNYHAQLAEITQFIFGQPLSRRSRNQTGEWAQTPLGRAGRIRLKLPAHAGAKEKSPVGSSRFGTFIISPKVFTHQQILLTSCRVSVRKGLMDAGAKLEVRKQWSD